MRHLPLVTPHLLITAIVQQTMVFIGQLATAGGVRAPLANVADQVFSELTRELLAQGLRKKVIADMFGMGLRTYHRRVQAAEQSKTSVGVTVWEAVLAYVQEHGPVSGAQVLNRFRNDDVDIVSGVLSDFANSGLVYRAGRGDHAVYRIAPDADFEDGADRRVAHDHLVWVTVYRTGPAGATDVSERTGIDESDVRAALDRLFQEGRVERSGDSYVSARFEVPWGSTQGWEAAVLDHFQAMVTAITTKLSSAGRSKGLADVTGGSTWSLDVWPGHPMEAEARGTLRALRETVEGLRARIDAHNQGASAPTARDRVVVYLGQYVQRQEPDDADTNRAGDEARREVTP